MGLVKTFDEFSFLLDFFTRKNVTIIIIVRFPNLSKIYLKCHISNISYTLYVFPSLEQLDPLFFWDATPEIVAIMAIKVIR